MLRLEVIIKDITKSDTEEVSDVQSVSGSRLGKNAKDSQISFFRVKITQEEEVYSLACKVH